MPKQRKIFRIEEMGRGEIPSEGFAETAEHASRHAELMTELRALRAMMANGKPVAAGDAPAQEANAVALKVQAKLKSQFDVIEQAFKKTKDDIVSLESTGLDGGQVARIRQELAAVKEGTTDATDRILKSAETIEQGASTLVAALKGGHEQGLAQDIQDQVTQIFEACNFHDLTSQRISKVVSSLTLLEDHIAQMVQIWNAIERFTNYIGRLTPPDGDGFLNGPKLDGDEGHASQNDIDALFH